MLVVFDDDSFDRLIFRIFLSRGDPWIRLERFDGERYFAVFYLDDADTHLVSHFKTLTRIINERPVDLADMHEPLEPLFEFDEYAEINRAGDHTVHIVTHGVFLDDLLLLFFSLALLGEDELSFLRG